MATATFHIPHCYFLENKLTFHISVYRAATEGGASGPSHSTGHVSVNVAFILQDVQYSYIHCEY